MLNILELRCGFVSQLDSFTDKPFVIEFSNRSTANVREDRVDWESLKLLAGKDVNVADINPTSLSQLIEELKSKGAKTLQVCQYVTGQRPTMDNGFSVDCCRTLFYLLCYSQEGFKRLEFDLVMGYAANVVPKAMRSLFANTLVMITSEASCEGAGSKMEMKHSTQYFR